MAVSFVSITHIHNESYETIIDMYDNDDTLFYCDPPYFKNEDYYVQDFQRHQHKELIEKLKEYKSKFVLSYYDFPELETSASKTRVFLIEKEFNKQNASKSKGKEVKKY